MSVWRVAATMAMVVETGCGRWQFDERPPDADPGDDATPDTSALSCPAGFIAIPGNVEFGTNDFCIMMFEAVAWTDIDADTIVDDSELVATGCDAACSADGLATYTPVPVPGAVPWHDVSASLAQDRCRSLGLDYDLTSNREWMTIARLAELRSDNWSTGEPGNGRVYEGNTYGSSTTIATPGDPYAGTGHTAADPVGSGWEAKRTLKIVGDVEIWDFAGNEQEWVDWTTGDALDPAPSCGGTRELSAIAASCTGYVDADYAPGLTGLSSANGIGLFIGGTGTAVRRGGQVGDRSLGIAGIYGFNINRDVNQVFGATGFRCVYRPPP